MARFYLLACFAGTLLPFAAFGEWITHHGFSPMLLITTIWQQPLALFAWLDVIVTALVLIIFADLEGRRVGMPCRWVTPLCNLLRGTLTWVTAVFVDPASNAGQWSR